MRIVRASGVAGAAAARDVAVIIDVFRAFTTAAFCVGAGAREVVLVGTAEEALALKAADPGLFLTGEIGGRPIAGFDAGNSPALIERLDLRGRRVVQRTSGGTQGVVAARTARRVALGSLVIASATARYVASLGADEVALVEMGGGGSAGTNEDDECGAHLEALLLGAPGDRAAMLARIWADERPDWPEWFPRRDAELACEVDRFDFALPVSREDGLLVARPVRA